MAETSSIRAIKRVAAVLPAYFGGGETVTNALVNALKPHGFEFILITSSKNAKKQADVITEVFDQSIGLDIELAHYSKTTTNALANVLRPLNIDILWLIGDEFCDIPVLRHALKPNAKIIYHLHSVPFFQIRLKDTFNGNHGNRLAYANWYLFKHMREKLFRLYQRRYKKRTRKTAADVDTFITLCESYARQLAEIYPEYADKFHAIYNPIINEQTSYTPADKKNEIIYLGRLTHADKRPDLLLNIFAKVAPSHPQWRLIIVGDGPDRNKLEQLAIQLNICRQTRFIGFSHNPSVYLVSASILCQTSAFEGWPMAIVEGMQQGVVPIAFNCSAGVEELLSDGRGILVEPDNINEYAAHLTELMDSPSLRRQILDTHHTFLQKLGIKNIIRQWLSL